MAGTSVTSPLRLHHSNPNLYRPRFHTRTSRSGKFLGYWECPHCGDHLGMRDILCRHCKLRVRDYDMVRTAVAEHATARARWAAATSTAAGLLVRTRRADGTRPRCLYCGGALALNWWTCKHCRREIPWATADVGGSGGHAL